MADYFEYGSTAEAGGIATGDLKRIEECVRAQYGPDDMMFELRMLRTVRAIVDGGVTVEQAIAELSPRRNTNGNGKPPFDEVWARIIGHQGETFTQVRGGEFRYEVRGNTIIPNRTHQQFARAQIEAAYARMPVNGPGALQDLRGPSYLFAVLMDDRIRQGQW